MLPETGSYGTYYWATDLEALYRDDGGVWWQITPSAWQVWSPTITLQDGGGSAVTNVTATIIGTATGAYRLLPGKMIEIQYNAVIKLSGTQRFMGFILTTPLSGTLKSQPINADVLNDLARARVTADYVSIFPHSGYNAQQHALDPSQPIGQWYVDNYTPGRNFDLGGVYRAF